MDKFIVSARKYRPQNFATVVGQSHITTTLKNAIKNGHLAHAFLFCGPRGVGKTTCARILAKTINCENLQPDGEACNVCHSCTSFNDGASMNIHELDAASNNSVDDIRALVEQVRFAPQAGRYKVYIIDEVHMLSSSAFNAFLKTLEEPPSYAIFILATTEKHKILPTILSRCQIFDFKRITVNDTVEHLAEITDKEKIHAEKTALQLIAQKSEGCMRDALSILDKIASFTDNSVTYGSTLEHLNVLDADYYFRMLESMQKQDLASALLLFEDINRKGFEPDVVVNGFAEFFRNLLVSKDQKAAVLLEVLDAFKPKYIRTASELSLGFMISALNILNECEINYRTARNKKLHVELALIKLTYLQQALDLSGTEKAPGVSAADSVQPVAFRRIRPIAAPVQKSQAAKEAKLFVPANEPSDAINLDAKLELKPETVTAPQPSKVSEKPAEAPVARKIGRLDAIRQHIAGNQTGGEAIAAIPLNKELLETVWREYSSSLKDAKNPAVQSFDRARLEVVDDSNFLVVCNNNLEQRFIEQEKRSLMDLLKSRFTNKFLQFTIVIQSDGAAQPDEKIPLSKREQYKVLIEQYPILKELKDKLRLEVDY
jgi:DNA polymerase III subunit gamma/tau